MSNNESWLPGFDTYFRNLLPAESDDCGLAQQQQQKGKKVFLLCLSFLSFTLLSIIFLFCSAIIGEQKEIPLYCISDYDVTSQSFQSMSDTDLLQIKSIAIETTFRNTFPFSQKKNTFLTLLLFTSQSFQLMWDGDLFQIKSFAIQTMQIFKFNFFVLFNLTVRLRFIFVRVENLSRTNVFFFPL